MERILAQTLLVRREDRGRLCRLIILHHLGIAPSLAIAIDPFGKSRRRRFDFLDIDDFGPAPAVFPESAAVAFQCHFLGGFPIRRIDFDFPVNYDITSTRYFIFRTPFR
jgi:hypothetical protein